MTPQSPGRPPPAAMKTLDCDFLVIGSGSAGLLAAIHLSRHGRVFVVSKRARTESNTNYAQGGIACVVDKDDSIGQHLQDTLRTGCGLSEESVAREILEAGPDRIRELEQLGLRFATRKGRHPDEYDLGQEGGHSRRRVLHVGDITGGELIRVLLGRVNEEPDIKVIENWTAIDLVTTGWLGQDGPNRCVGAYFFSSDTGEVLAVRAGATLLATGGVGKTYLYTSNPDVATGDGLAMAWRAGLPVRDMEFIQFHPTCLYHPHAKSFLISEAVRGEGAELIDAAGRPFMHKFTGQGSLAPRDVTARAIDHIMKSRGDPCVYLDITHKSEEFLRGRFPNLYETCLRFGVDMARQPIPVVPAAHYSCGGVIAGTDGTTEMKGLFACGEVASTGLHGANRLASNSLLEALVCAGRAAERMADYAADEDGTIEDRIPSWKYGDAVHSDEAVVVEHNWNEVRSVMWDYVGIVRSDRRLARARKRITTIREEVRNYYCAYLITRDLLELRSVAAVAELIVRSAQRRRESRGLHYTKDYPEPSRKTPEHTIIRNTPGGPLKTD
ncbi:L-aspartate oxidase [Kiritimatiella glycovorans]|uniref:L-aspartate oxidase n=1 Tax=Kiritimatiella glycovorans TaxID=1307763 RepID=A0A0G3EGF8_9BACT|nr:L-aspartate oxidase [Kiritimatiella glycovorans]AKJ63870.1 L-aspartate oxidase [Kiritimatiella glycovorans]